VRAAKRQSTVVLTGEVIRALVYERCEIVGHAGCTVIALAYKQRGECGVGFALFVLVMSPCYLSAVRGLV